MDWLHCFGPVVTHSGRSRTVPLTAGKRQAEEDCKVSQCPLGPRRDLSVGNTASSLFPPPPHVAKLGAKPATCEPLVNS